MCAFNKCLACRMNKRHRTPAHDKVVTSPALSFRNSDHSGSSVSGKRLGRIHYPYGVLGRLLSLLNSCDGVVLEHSSVRSSQCSAPNSEEGGWDNWGSMDQENRG
jgi:hypothetical protein